MPCGPVVRLAVLVAAISPLVGCASNAFQVSNDPNSGGLPFYVKSAVYRQHSVYQYEWLRVSLSSAPVTGTKDGEEKLGAKTTRVVDIADDQANRDAVRRLQELVAALPGTPATDLQKRTDAITAAFANLKPLPPGYLKAPASADLRSGGNYVERITVVDYSRPYYLNGKVPAFGSSNLSTELAADGTLAKGSNSVTGGGADALNAIASAITGVLPIKEYLTSKWVPTPKTETALQNNTFILDIGGVGRVTGAIRYEVAVEPKAMLYDFTSDYTSVPNGGSLAHVPADFANGLYTIRAAEKAPEGEKDDGGISFSGKVQMPAEKKP